MRIKSIVLIFAITTLCYQCKNDPDLKYASISKENFQNKLNQLESYCAKSIASDDFLALSGYFYLITGRKPSYEMKTYSDFISDTDSIFYSSSNFRRDLKYWNNWFAKNHLFIPQELSDSIYARLSK